MVKYPELAAIWKLAVETGQAYNGKDGRYNNPAIDAG